MLACLAGCAVASPPIKATPQVDATPQNGQLTTSMQAGKAMGDVEPVYVSVANGTDEPRAIVPSQIFAINDVGERVAPLSPGEAARQAGEAGELKAALSSAAVSGVAAGAVGAGLGAIAGAGLGGWGTGALVGTAVGAGSGMLSGATQGQAKADRQATEQLEGVALQEEDVRRNFTVSGYVFFPKGTYRELEMVLVNHETGGTESIREPWH
jgi:L-aminopeptidase/D-esterase-like protein